MVLQITKKKPGLSQIYVHTMCGCTLLCEKEENLTAGADSGGEGRWGCKNDILGLGSTCGSERSELPQAVRGRRKPPVKKIGVCHLLGAFWRITEEVIGGFFISLPIDRV